MQLFRNTRQIARLVLVWFGLFIGVAVASPLVKPTGLQMVCTGSGGMKLVVTSDGDSDAQVSMGMDCPLCASFSAPPPTMTLPLASPSPLAHALHPIAAAIIAATTAPPLPSRGPPASTI